MTESGHASDSGERATASGHADLPSVQGNAYADGATGSGQQTSPVTPQAVHCVTSIDPRIETGHVETESSHAASGSGQKTATAPGTSGHKKRAKRTMNGVDALDLLTVNGKRSESENYGDGPRELLPVTWPSYPSLLLDPKIENHGEDNTRWQDYEVSLEFPRRGTCGENWGETTKTEAREKGVYSERAAPTSPAPEGEGEAGARPAHPRRQTRGTSTPLARPRSSGGEEAPRQNTRCTLRPLLLPLPS